jgi:hypothetical protein
MIPRNARLRLAALAAALALPLAMAACASPTGTDARDIEALASAKARWTALGIKSYTLVTGPRCYCGPPQQIRTTVVNGVVTEAVFVSNGSPVPPKLFDDIASVDAMLAYLDQRIREGADDVEARYDDRGIPVDASIDYSKQAIDEEFGWFVISFTPAP